MITDTIFDLCIIGSGPAGIIVALEYAKENPNQKIVLIEYGKREQKGNNTLDDSIEIKNTLNHHTPYECTNKGLGGTGRTWGGRCVMFDEVDFMHRPIIGENCTWEEELLSEVKKYTKKTAEYFECGSDEFDIDKIQSNTHKRIAEHFVGGNVSDSVLERWSMPTRFGSRYAAEIENTKNIVLLESTEARTFSEPTETGLIEFVEIQTSNGIRSKIYSKTFVIAAGAQESTRLLLRNKHLFNQLNFVPNALGKYYQGHISGKIASVKFFGDPKKTDYGFQRDTDGTYVRRRFQFSTEFLKTNNLLNTAIWLDNPVYHDPAHKSGAMSFMYLAMITPFLGKKLAPPAIQHSITKGKVNGIGKHLLNILKDFPFSLSVPFTIFYKRYCLKRKLPGVFLYNPQNRYALHYHGEQVPDARNSMTLAEDGNTLIINYELCNSDIQSIIKLHKELDRHLQNCNCGKLEYWYPESELFEAIKKNSKDGIHQSGTTRIAENANIGVVDKNLKVFGTENVYVCSTSVFPCSGQANPTFFLGAFALRLVKYLKTKS